MEVSPGTPEVISAPQSSSVQQFYIHSYFLRVKLNRLRLPCEAGTMIICSSTNKRQV